MYIIFMCCICRKCAENMLQYSKRAIVPIVPVIMGLIFMSCRSSSIIADLIITDFYDLHPPHTLIRAQSEPRLPLLLPKISPYRAPFKNNLKSGLFSEMDEIKRTQ